MSADSIQWIIQQYQLNVTLDELSCTTRNYKGFTINCGRNQITELSINADSTDVLVQDPPSSQRTAFSFAQMLNFAFTLTNSSRINDPSKSILSMITSQYMPRMFSIRITDNTITELNPKVFTSTSLYIVEINSVNITTLPSFALYPAGGKITMFSLPISPLNIIEFDSTKFTSILELEIVYSNSTDLFIDSSTFRNSVATNFISIKITLNGFSSNISIDTSYIRSLYITTDNQPNRPGVVLNGTMTTLNILNIIGNPSSFKPLNLSEFVSLEELKIDNAPGLFPTFPLFVIPENLVYLQYTGNGLTFFPNFIFYPNYVNRQVGVELSNNLITGNIPMEYFTLFDSVFTNGNPVGGTIPNEACQQYSFAAANTNIQDLPDCFKCYWEDQKINFENTPFYNNYDPSSFRCDIQYQKHYISYDIQTITIVGNNLGWGNQMDSEIQKAIVPNQQLVYNIDPSLAKTPVGIILSIPSEVNIEVTYELQSFSFVDVSLVQNQGLDYFDSVRFKMQINFTSDDFQYFFVYVDGAECGGIFPSFFHNSLQETIGSLRNYTSGCTPIAEGVRNVTVVDPYTTQTIFVNFTQSFPIVETVSDITTEGGIITLTGIFSLDNDGYNRSVTIGGHNCTIIANTDTTIECEVLEKLEKGYLTLEVVDLGFKFKSNNLVKVSSSSSELIEYCQETFSNCTGNGTCDATGRCACDHGKFGINCDQTLAIGPVIIGEKTPSATIVYKDFKFTFSILAIQEITPENEVVKEIEAENQWKIENVNEGEGIITTNYIHDISIPPLKSKSHKGRNLIGRMRSTTAVDPPYITSTVQITNSSTYFDINFAGQNISIGPNSVKISAYISGWTYQSKVNSLRVTYKSPVSLDECNEKENTNTFVQNKDQSSIQYLRVFKDDVEFLGRFPRMASADGRSVISPTVLINQTIIPNSNQSTAILGITIPQCQECEIDPDFGSLLRVQDKSSNKDKCGNEKKSNSWKVIVGVVVGIMGAAFIVGAAIFFVKRSKFRKDHKKMQAKLRSLDKK